MTVFTNQTSRRRRWRNQTSRRRRWRNQTSRRRRWRNQFRQRRGVSSRRLVEASQVEEDQRGGHDGHADEDVRGDVLVVWVVLERGRDEFLDGDENHHPRDEAEEGTERGGGHV